MECDCGSVLLIPTTVSLERYYRCDPPESAKMNIMWVVSSAFAVVPVLTEPVRAMF